MSRDEAVAFHIALIDQFISSFSKPPDELILDFDATDDAVHGQPEGRFFHGSPRHRDSLVARPTITVKGTTNYGAP